MCKCAGKCGCNITTTTKGEKGDASSSATLGYKVYIAIITQSLTGAPVPTVLQNTLGGAIAWTRNGAGDYTGTLAGAFVDGKTVVSVPNSIPSIALGTDMRIIQAGWNNINSVYIATSNVALVANTITYTDSLLYGSNTTSIEIRVYS